MERLNYTASAIDSLLAAQKAGRLASSGIEARGIAWLVDCLQKAVKFMLPDMREDALIAETDISRAMELVRLPYPIIAIEYKVGGEWGGSDLEVAAPRRIALCFAPSSPMLDDSQLFPVLDSRDDLDGIYVMSIFEVDGSGLWFCVPALVFVSSSGKKERGSSFGVLEHQQRAGWGIRNRLIPFPLKSLWKSYADAWSSPDDVAAAISSDVGDEVRTATAFCQVLNCSNVQIETLAVSESVNRRRVRKGKRPLYEYRVLTIDITTTRKVGSSVEESGRASPRQHLRRGHIRRMGDKVVWVNASLVGNHGRIEKAYRIKGGSNVA